MSIVEVQGVTQGVVLVFPGRVARTAAPAPIEPPYEGLPPGPRRELRPLAHLHEGSGAGRPPSPARRAPARRFGVRIGQRGRGPHALPPRESDAGRSAPGTETAGEAEAASRVGEERV